MYDSIDEDTEDTGPVYDLNFADERTKVARAFEQLRVAGFIARERFLCCAGCALSALTAELKKMPTKERAKVRGVVFYHEQDDEAWQRNGRRINLYVRFTEAETDDTKQTDAAWLAVGYEVFMALKDAGLRVVWDRKTTSCIEVVLR